MLSIAPRPPVRFSSRKTDVRIGLGLIALMGALFVVGEVTRKPLPGPIGTHNHSEGCNCGGYISKKKQDDKGGIKPAQPPTDVVEIPPAK